MNRWRDWWDQAERDLRHARHAIEDQGYEWSAFAGQQAAEKALMGLIMSRGGEAEGAIADAQEIIEFCRRHLP